MKVKDMIRSLMDKDPNDDVSIKVKVKLYTNDKHVYNLERQVEIDDITDGGWPVVLTADLTINVESRVEIY